MDNSNIKDFNSYKEKRHKIEDVERYNYDLEAIEAVLNKYGLSLSNRAEEISCVTFVDIVKTIF